MTTLEQADYLDGARRRRDELYLEGLQLLRRVAEAQEMRRKCEEEIARHLPGPFAKEPA